MFAQGVDRRIEVDRRFAHGHGIEGLLSPFDQGTAQIKARIDQGLGVRIALQPIQCRPTPLDQAFDPFAPVGCFAEMQRHRGKICFDFTPGDGIHGAFQPVNVGQHCIEHLAKFGHFLFPERFRLGEGWLEPFGQKVGRCPLDRVIEGAQPPRKLECEGLGLCGRKAAAPRNAEDAQSVGLVRQACTPNHHVSACFLEPLSRPRQDFSLRAPARATHPEQLVLGAKAEVRAIGFEGVLHQAARGRGVVAAKLTNEYAVAWLLGGAPYPPVGYGASPAKQTVQPPQQTHKDHDAHGKYSRHANNGETGRNQDILVEPGCNLGKEVCVGHWTCLIIFVADTRGDGGGATNKARWPYKSGTVSRIGRVDASRWPIDEPAMTTLRTRFAPSPTGPLHLGHALSAVLVRRAADVANGEALLRIENVDVTRCRPEYDVAIREDLEWLGLRWDGPVRRQSRHFDEYLGVVAGLRERGLVYRCFLTRQEISARFPNGIVRSGPMSRPEENARLAAGVPFAWRLSLEAARSEMGALFFDALTFALEEDGRIRNIAARPEIHGDIALTRKDCPAAYHLAATHDDAIQGITYVIRGQDLAEAPHIQVLLQALMDWPRPVYHHHRLLFGEDGKRLSKTHRSKSLAALRTEGLSPADVLALAGL